MAESFKTLPGFRDFYPEDCAHRNYLFSVWRRVAARYGFKEYDGPVLEPTELYKKKSGNEIVNQLFCFDDKGDRAVSMRPELTPTLARMAAARQRDYRKPMRWFSIGQFFRYERHQKGRGREFYQFNCDTLGEDSSQADAELISLSIDLMRELGFTKDDFQIGLSDRNAWVHFAAESGLTEEQTLNFLQIIDKMGRTPAEKLESSLAELNLTKDRVDAFIAKGATVSERIPQVLQSLEARGLSEFVKVNLNIVRGLAYYTSTVFEIFDVSKGMRAIAGGGRYNQLVKLIGNADMPAFGFAMGDMVILDLIKETPHANQKMLEAIHDQEAADIAFILADDDRYDDLLACTQEARNAGFSCVTPLAAQKVGKQFQAAEQAGTRLAVVIGSEYPEIQIKSLKDRSAITTQKESLLATISKTLDS